MYPEIWKPRDEAPTFPSSCPVCGAQRISGSELGDTSYRAMVKYGCGGEYVLKTQIQTHTDKWWGQCGATEQPSEPLATPAETKSRVIVEIRGGVVVAVYSSIPRLFVAVLDWDNAGDPDADHENAKLEAEAKALQAGEWHQADPYVLIHAHKGVIHAVTVHGGLAAAIEAGKALAKREGFNEENDTVDVWRPGDSEASWQYRGDGSFPAPDTPRLQWR